MALNDGVVELSPTDVDKAMEHLKKSIETEEITLTPDTENKEVKKAVVSKRAMGGATETEDDHSSGGGRLYKDGKATGEHPADGGYKDNFATAYPMDVAAADGSALSGAIKDSAVTKKDEKYKRGMTKAVKSAKSSKSSKSSASSSSSKMSKAIGSDGASAIVSNNKSSIGDGSSAPSKTSAAPKPTSETMEKTYSGSSMSKNYSHSGSSMSKGAVSSMLGKAVGDSQSSMDSDGKSNGSATPKEETAKGSTSGAKRMNKSVTPEIGKYLSKGIAKIESGKRHLTKAFEDGSGKDLNIAGQRLIEGKQALLKAINKGETVSNEIVSRLDKAATYYMKSLDAYENEDFELHSLAVAKSTHNMEKALNTFKTFQKSLVKSVEKPETKVVNGVKFIKKSNGQYEAILDENAYKVAKRALNEKGLYKSFGDEFKTDEKANKTLEVSDFMKSLVGKLVKSNDSLRDAILDKNEKEDSFKEDLVKSLGTFSDAINKITKDVEKLRSTANLRKSIVSPVDSPMEEGKKSGSIEKAMVGDLLLKGLEAGKVKEDTVLRWDVVKDMVQDVPEEFARICQGLAN